jgi:hypothetical protein
MRKLWIAVGVLFLLLLAAGIIVVLSLDRLVARNQNGIIEQARAQAQAVLGRDVAIARISVSLWDGIGVRLDDVRIADDADFGSEDFVRVAALTARAKLWPLLHGRFEVSRITAVQPHINLIRDATGRWNYTTLRPLVRQDTSALAPGILLAATAPGPAAPGTSRALPFVVEHAAVSDGTLIVVDRTQTPVRTTQVAHVDVTFGYTSPTAPIAVSVAAAVAADARNVDVHGSVGPWGDGTAVPLQLDGALGPLAPSKARVDALHIVATLAPERLHVSELTCRLFGGSFALSGDYPLQANGAFALKGSVTDVAVADAIPAATAASTQRVAGKAHLTVDVRGSGTSREAIEASLAGSVAVDVKDGVIKDLNIANEVLGGASRLPVIGTVVSAPIRLKYARLFADPDTRFETLHGTFMIGGQGAQTDDLTIVATEFSVLGRGRIAFNRQADLAATLRMSQRFSDDLVADVKAAKYLLDEHGQLAVPFHLRGTLGEAKPTLASDDLIAIVQRGAARGAVTDLLDKFLGAPRQPTPGEKRDRLDEGLRRLFGH